MPIDPSIALQAKGVQLATPESQLNMMASAAKLNEYNRSVDEQNALRDLIKSGVDIKSPEARQKMYEISPEMGIKFEKSQAELNKSALEGRKLGVEVEQKTFDLVKQKMADLAFNPSDNNIKAHLEDGILRKEVTPQQAQATWQAVSALPLDKRKAYFTDLGMKAAERAQMETTRRGQDLTYGATIRGQNLSNDPTLQGNIAASRAAGTEYGKAGAQANIALPGAIATGEEAIRKVDELVGKAPVVNAEGKVVTPGTKAHKGFESAVGATLMPGLRFIPGTSASDFMARLNEIQGGAFLQAFTTLKGGGSITEKEGEKATAAINRMSTAQSEKEFNTAAREYQDVLRTGIDRAKVKAARSAGGSGIPNGRTPPPAGEIDFNSLN
jgi:hypothetical protein